MGGWDYSKLPETLWLLFSVVKLLSDKGSRA